MSRFDGCSSFTRRPAIRISPEVIGSSPAIVLSKVDLPQPEGPTRTRKPPSSMSRSMPFRIFVEPKDFSRLLISRNDICLSLDRAGHQPAHEIATRHDVDDEGRQCGEDRASEMNVVFLHAGRRADEV